MVVTRFAPSPTGPLHLGHACAAIFAHDMARAAGGRFLLRIEDIDRQRSRPEWEQAICDDLQWLGLTWDGVMRQSQRMAAYQGALDGLWARGLLYPCRCSRRDIDQALGAPQEGVQGPDGPVYPGTCRAEVEGSRPLDQHLRLNMRNAVQGIDALSFTETIFTAEAGDKPQSGLLRTAPDAAASLPGRAPNGPAGLLPTDRSAPGRQILTTAADYSQNIGDIILARKDFGTSYHLCVVLDDAAQGVTHVTRGGDLFEATRIHVLLQRLLGLSSPVYCHHGLVRDAAGKRLAKRDDARALAKYRAEGATPEDIRRLVGLGSPG